MNRKVIQSWDLTESSFIIFLNLAGLLKVGEAEWAGGAEDDDEQVPGQAGGGAGVRVLRQLSRHTMLWVRRKQSRQQHVARQVITGFWLVDTI